MINCIFCRTTVFFTICFLAITLSMSQARATKIQSRATVGGYTATERFATDATGSDGANRRLSQQRADSVKSFLQAEFGLSNIETTGRSSDKLRDTDNPSSGLNRRVEFVPNW